MGRIPSNANISSYINDSYFSDCFSLAISYKNQSALDIFLYIARETPSWVTFLMSLRNKIVSKFGLKDLGKIEDIELGKFGVDYKVGERIGIFKLYSNTHNEVILEDQDEHLNVKFSFYIEPNGNTAVVHASTIVHVKNASGRVYMFFVVPVHKMIVPSMLKKLNNQGKCTSG